MYKYIFGVLTIGLLIFYGLRRQSWLPTAKTGEVRQSIEHKGEILRFFAVADTGSGNENQYKVADAMDRLCAQGQTPEGIIIAGDLFYTRGVTSTKDPQWEEKILTPYKRGCLASSRIYPIAGNHDYKGNVDALIEYSHIDPFWVMPFRFYRLDFGKKLRLIAFDSSFPDFCLSPNHCSIDFVLDELKTSNQKWNVVFAHHPLRSSSTHGFGHSGGIMGFFLRPFVCGKADVWLSGHAHHLEHRNEKDCATHMLQIGGGGGDLYDVRSKDSGAEFLKKSLGFVELLISQDQMTFNFFDENASLLHSYTQPHGSSKRS